MEKKVHWLEMVPDELLAAIEEHPVCYCAYGLAEPHGPYNPIGLDFLKARGICERAAREHGGVVAPPFAWHVQDRPMFDWCAKQGITQTLTSPIPADLWLRTVCHQIGAFDRRGFRVAFLITGHYGGLEVDMRLLCEYYRRRTGTPLELWAGADWELITRGDYRGDHAGMTETSQMLALRPELVDLSRKVDGWPTGRWAGHEFPTKDGRTPSAELGEQIVGSQIERLGELQRDLLGAYVPKEDYTPPNMDEVDDLWFRFERQTRKYWVLSLTYDEFMKGERVDFPGWEALGM